MMQHIAYSEKQIGINPRATENLIKVFTGVMHLLGQPGDAPALPLEFCPDEVANMKIVSLRYAVVCRHYHYSLSGKHIPFYNRVSNDRFLVQQKKKIIVVPHREQGAPNSLYYDGLWSPPQ